MGVTGGCDGDDGGGCSSSDGDVHYYFFSNGVFPAACSPPRPGQHQVVSTPTLANLKALMGREGEMEGVNNRSSYISSMTISVYINLINSLTAVISI